MNNYAILSIHGVKSLWALSLSHEQPMWTNSSVNKGLKAIWFSELFWCNPIIVMSTPILHNAFTCNFFDLIPGLCDVRLLTRACERGRTWKVEIGRWLLYYLPVVNFTWTKKWELIMPSTEVPDSCVLCCACRPFASSGRAAFTITRIWLTLLVHPKHKPWSIYKFKFLCKHRLFFFGAEK